jgi:hypothetical protein
MHLVLPDSLHPCIVFLLLHSSFFSILRKVGIFARSPGAKHRRPARQVHKDSHSLPKKQDDGKEIAKGTDRRDGVVRCVLRCTEGYVH